MNDHRKLIEELDHSERRLVEDRLFGLPPELVTPGVLCCDMRNRCAFGNLTTSSDLPWYQHLVCAGPMLIGLLPKSEKFIEDSLGLNFRELEELVENRLIVPGIYVRNPDDWRESDVPTTLIKHAIVGGARTDAYFNALIPESFDELKKEMELKVRAELTVPEILASKFELFDDPENLLVTFSRRLANLKAINSELADQLLAELSDSKLSESADKLRREYLLNAAHITSALGSDFYLQTTDLQSIGIDQITDAADLKQADRMQKIISRFVLEELLSIPPGLKMERQKLLPAHLHELSRVLLTREWTEEFENLQRCVNQLAHDLTQDSPIASVAEFRQEMNRLNKRVELSAKILNISISATSGFVIGSLMGGLLLGSLLGSVSGALTAAGVEALRKHEPDRRIRTIRSVQRALAAKGGSR